MYVTYSHDDDVGSKRMKRVSTDVTADTKMGDARIATTLVLGKFNRR